MNNSLDTFFNELEHLLEDINLKKDKVVFSLVQSYWPRRITPNHLTIARIMIGMALFILLFNFRIDNGWLILPFFFIGILTDLLDGVLARGFNMVSKFGAMTDPIADRVILVPIAVYSLIELNKFILFFLLVLEVINALISVIAHGKEVFSGSNIFGKTKMFLQSLVFMGILIFWPQEPHIFFIYILWISLICMLISIASKIIQLETYYASKKRSVNI